MGLVNRIGEGCRLASIAGFVPGQLLPYAGPSKSLSLAMHPMIGWNGGVGMPKEAGLKQAKSSPSKLTSPAPAWLHSKKLSTALQYSKWPISSEKEML